MPHETHFHGKIKMTCFIPCSLLRARENDGTRVNMEKLLREIIREFRFHESELFIQIVRNLTDVKIVSTAFLMSFSLIFPIIFRYTCMPRQRSRPMMICLMNYFNIRLLSVQICNCNILVTYNIPIIFNVYNIL